MGRKSGKATDDDDMKRKDYLSKKSRAEETYEWRPFQYLASGVS